MSHLLFYDERLIQIIENCRGSVKRSDGDIIDTKAPCCQGASDGGYTLGLIFLPELVIDVECSICLLFECFVFYVNGVLPTVLESLLVAEM